MRRFLIQTAAVALFTTSAAFLTTPSYACISFDHRAEMRTVDRAIASRKTPAAIRIKLKALRAEMTGRPGDTAAGEALKLIGKDRILKRAAATRGTLPRGVQATGCG